MPLARYGSAGLPKSLEFLKKARGQQIAGVDEEDGEVNKMAENSIRSTGSNKYESKPIAFNQRDVNAQPKEIIKMLQPQHLQDPAPKQSCHRAKRVALSSQLASAATSLPTTCSQFN
jgi:hypothetical protein